MSDEAQVHSHRVGRGVDPDVILQRVLDLINAEVRRLRQKMREPVIPCEMCGRLNEPIDKDERAFLSQAARELRQVAFGGRKMLAQSLLSKLSDEQLTALDEGMRGREWMPK